MGPVLGISCTYVSPILCNTNALALSHDQESVAKRNAHIKVSTHVTVYLC